MQSYLATFAGDLKRSFLDLATVIGVVLAFQLVVLREIPADWPALVLGLVIVGVGLALFMRGLEIGLFPLGEELAGLFAHSSSRAWLIVFAFVIGFSTVIAEPALIAIADKAAIISNGVIDAVWLRVVTALSVGVAIVIGVVRLLLNHPIHWYIIVGYAIAIAITPFAPPEIVGLAYDSGGVTTSTVTVPLIAALGIGLATALKNRNPVIDGFGLIAFAALLPVIFVQIYGIVLYTTGAGAGGTPAAVEFGTSALGAAAALAPGVMEYVTGFLYSVGNLIPIVLTIGFFYYVVLRRRIESFAARAAGFLFIVFGLYAFVIGLEIGLFPVGETIAISLAENGNMYLLYLFAFTIGFATTVAEPSLTAVARKAEEISGGAINSLYLRVFVAVGVGVGILLGAYRIVNGDSLVFYIVAGYVGVLILTLIAPRTMIPIAYDSGGVTTSTVTVPIVAALGLGLASTIAGRDPLIDGFGLIALASIFPMVAVLLYGIGEQQNIRRHERYIKSLEETAMVNVREPHSAAHTLREAKIRKHIITISGGPGSGTTSVAKRVADILRYRYFSSGDVFRQIAAERGVSLDDLNRDAETERHLDREIDLIIRILGEEARHIVINSRLGYHWIHGSFKVHLTVPLDVAAERTFKDIQAHGRSGESAATLEDARASVESRMRLERERYLDLYGVDVSNHKTHDLVIDTSKRSIEDAARQVVAAYSAWIGSKT